MLMIKLKKLRLEKTEIFTKAYCYWQIGPLHYILVLSTVGDRITELGVPVSTVDACYPGCLCDQVYSLLTPMDSHSPHVHLRMPCTDHS